MALYPFEIMICASSCEISGQRARRCAEEWLEAVELVMNVSLAFRSAL